MAKFRFDPVNEFVLWYNCFSAYDDDMGASSDDDYDGYLDEDEDEDAGYDDEDEYDGEEYEDDAGEYDEDGYDDEYGDEGGEYDGAEEYEDGEEYDDAEEYEDGGEDDGAEEYDEGEEYEDDGGEYDDADGEEYSDDELYEEDGEEEYDDEELGYDPKVFDKLSGDADEDEYEDEYDDQYDEDYPPDDADGAPEDGDFEDQVQDGWFDKIKAALDNDYVIYALCALIPLLALWLIWRNKRFDNNKKWILTGVAAVFLIIWMIICWPKGSDDTTTVPQGTFNNAASDPFDSGADDNDIPFVSDDKDTDTGDDSTGTANVTDTTQAGVNANTGTGTTANADTGTIVWTMNANLYYHTKPDCGGMSGATSMTIDAAKQRGKMACPECAGGTSLFGDAVTESVYYATKDSTYYHTNPTCTGMTDASEVTQAAALRAGKLACPTCVGYYGTPGGSKYHAISNCQGMQNAVIKTEDEWKALGKERCPNCLSGSGNTVKTTGQPTETQVFCTNTSTYFHTVNDCSGMTGANQVSISEAINAGKKACLRCVSPSRVYVFAISGGTYYHTKNNCSGMTDASCITAKVAIIAGKKACPKCNAKDLSSSSASNSTVNVNRVS